ncbi:MAG: hypothetical protein WBI96_00015 [Candidatus Hydrothermia bacterium]
MKLKIRELSYLERAALLDIISQWGADGNTALIGIEILARTLEIEGEPLEETRKAGIVIRKLSDSQMEKILSELSAEDIGRYIQEALEKNKLFFATRGTTGGTDTEDS